MNRVGRFVAGAQCPQCGAFDRLKVDTLEGDSVWCVVCGYQARLSDAISGGHDAVAIHQMHADEPTLVRLVDLHQSD